MLTQRSWHERRTRSGPRHTMPTPLSDRSGGGRAVLPLALYLDGVPMTKRDGVLGIWMYNLVSMKRHLVAVLRKSSMCKCGCHGWDSLHAVWCFVHWSLRAMAAGRFPEKRHDNQAWKAADSQRGSLAGTPLAFCGMLLQIKGDWSEFASSLGFSNWADNQCPCPFCKTSKASLFDFSGFGPLTSVHAPATAADYNAACDACEQKRTLSESQWRIVKNCLEYSKSKTGPKGRALLKDIEQLGLARHDRLEPDSIMQDVADFDTATAFPLEVRFWRRGAETRVRRRCAVFDDTLGISVDVLCVDTLHCLYLGPIKDWCCAVFWATIDHNVFGMEGKKDHILAATVLRLKNLLFAYYAKVKRSMPEEHLTELEDLTPGMLGSQTHRQLATKAMETKHLVPFCLDLLRMFSGAIESALVEHYIGIGEAFSAYIKLLRDSPFVVPAANIQKMYDCMVRVLRLWSAIKLPKRPKLHQLMHLVDRTPRQGNPAYYATWADEGLNRVLGSLGRQAHRQVWEARILAYFEASQEHVVKRRRF